MLTERLPVALRRRRIIETNGDGLVPVTAKTEAVAQAKARQAAAKKAKATKPAKAKAKTKAKTKGKAKAKSAKPATPRTDSKQARFIEAMRKPDGIALFIDGATSAVAQAMDTCAGSWSNIRLYWQGTLSAGPHTFQLRLGSLNTSGIYTLMNDAGAMGGGAMKNSMVIREIGVGAAGPQGPAGPAGTAWSRLVSDTVVPAGPGVATIDVAIPAGVLAVQLVGFLMPVNNAVTPVLQFQTGGSTWQTGANYNGGGVYGSPQPAAAGFGSQAANSIVIAPANSILNSAVGGLAFDLKLANVQCPVGLPLLTGSASFWGGANINAEAVTGHLNIAATPITGVRLQFTSGNIAAGSRLSVLALQ